MTKSDAEKELDRLLEVQKFDVYCPLIRGECRLECICLTKKIDKTVFTAKLDYTVVVRCDNKMLFGENYL